MKKKLKAFTLVELIVVISILVLTASSGIFYFLDFVKNKEIEQKIENIKYNISKLDKQIENYKIFDYRLDFNTNTGSLGYTIYTNNFDIDNHQYINLNTKTGSGEIKISGTGTGTLKFYKGEKLFSLTYIENGDIINFDFNTEKKYKITSTLSGEILNNIYINYFSKDNLNNGLEKNNLLNLVNINTKKDKTGTDITNLIITNIGGKKVFYNNGTTLNNNEIFLFFESNGVEKFIKITK